MNVLNFILYSVKDIVMLAAVANTLHSFFSAEIRKNKTGLCLWTAFILLYSASAIFFLSAYTEFTYEYLDGFSFVATMAALFVVLKKPPVRATVCLSAVTVFTVDMLWSFMSSFFGDNLTAELIFNILVYSALFSVVFIYSRKHGDNVFAGVFREIPRWIIFVLLFFEVTCYYREFGISERWYDFFYAISACMVFICILYLIFRIFSLVFTQNKILQRLNEQLAFAEISSKSDDALRAFRHDYKNHLIVLSSMFEQGDYEGAKKYFNILSGSISDDVNRFTTGNSVVNSLLAVKKSTAVGMNAEIIFDGLIPQEGIENNDMCTVIGNLLDNALEACEKLPDNMKKQIFIHAHTKNNVLYISVKNPVHSAVDSISRQKMPKTTKKDVNSHGFGLKNVKKAVEKYDGSLSLNCENGSFIAEVMMKIR